MSESRRDPAAEVLRAAYLGLAVIAIGVGTIGLALGSVPLWRWLVEAGFGVAIPVTGLRMLRRGQHRAAAAMAVIATHLLLALLGWTGGGLTALWAIWSVLLALLAAVVLPYRGAVMSVVASSLLGVMLELARRQAWLPASHLSSTPAFLLVAVVAAGGVAIFAVDRYASLLKGAVEDARAEIEARRRAEAAFAAEAAKYADLVEAVPGGVFAAERAPDGAARFQLVSPGIERVTRLTPEAVSAKPVLLERGIPPEDFQRISRSLLAAVANGTIWSDEFPFVDPDHRTRRLQVEAVARATDSGAVAMQGVLLDASDRYAAEEGRREIERHLASRQKTEALGALAAGVARAVEELVTELTRQVEAIRAPDADPTSMAAFESTAQRARDLVGRVLQFARPTSEAPRQVSLADAVGRTVELLRATAPSTVNLVWVPSADSPRVMIEPARLDQALTNVAINAIQALPGDRGSVWFGVDRVTLAHAPGGTDLAPGEYARVQIRDDGIGMQAETRRRMFEPFFTTRPAGQSSGLGLAVVEATVRAVGGAVQAESTIGEGTLVSVYLPLEPHAARPGSSRPGFCQAPSSY